jgi:hypothetical protein
LIQYLLLAIAPTGAIKTGDFQMNAYQKLQSMDTTTFVSADALTDEGRVIRSARMTALAIIALVTRDEFTASDRWMDLHIAYAEMTLRALGYLPDTCEAEEIEETCESVTCETCGGDGEIVIGRWHNGDEKTITCDECGGDGFVDDRVDERKLRCHH